MRLSCACCAVLCRWGIELVGPAGPVPPVSASVLMHSAGCLPLACVQPGAGHGHGRLQVGLPLGNMLPICTKQLSQALDLAGLQLEFRGLKSTAFGEVPEGGDGRGTGTTPTAALPPAADPCANTSLPEEASHGQQEVSKEVSLNDALSLLSGLLLCPDVGDVHSLPQLPRYILLVSVQNCNPMWLVYTMTPSRCGRLSRRQGHCGSLGWRSSHQPLEPPSGAATQVHLPNLRS